MRSLLFLVIGAIILAGAAWLIYSNMSSGQPASTGTPAPGQTSTPEATVAGTPVATISYTDAGFSPKNVSVKSGDTIAITNNSSRTIQFNSNPHPTHADNNELNVGTIPPGETMKVKLTSKGTWGYHDHLNAVFGGTIVVQ